MAPSKPAPKKMRRPLAIMALLLAGAMTLGGCAYYDYPSYRHGYYGDRYYGDHYRRHYRGRDHYRDHRPYYRRGPYHR